MDRYVILELIPTSIKKENGILVQLSALKIENLQLLGSFDYRINEEQIPFKDLVDLVCYDKDDFTYKNSTEEILEDFIKWIGDDKLLIMDNDYTKNYLEGITNEKESIFDKLNMKYNDNIIEEVIRKYKLEPSNYIVDILYEALIYESNKKSI